MVREMLSVIMDGIKDADMLYDYAAKALKANDDTYSWFMNHAKIRVEQLCEDYKALNQEINLESKAASGDEIAEALMEHLQYEISNLKKS